MQSYCMPKNVVKCNMQCFCNSHPKFNLFFFKMSIKKNKLEQFSRWIEEKNPSDSTTTAYDHGKVRSWKGKSEIECFWPRILVGVLPPLPDQNILIILKFDNSDRLFTPREREKGMRSDEPLLIWMNCDRESNEVLALRANGEECAMIEKLRAKLS